MKSSILAGSCAIVLALGMSFSGSAAANPSYACGPENEGGIGYVDDFSWRGDGTRFVYQCWASNWYLVDIQYCSQYSGEERILLPR